MANPSNPTSHPRQQIEHRTASAQGVLCTNPIPSTATVLKSSCEVTHHGDYKLYMAWNQSHASGDRTASPTVFEQQREELVREIAVGMEQVLQNMNRLNRNLESVIAVGNEFSSVEALWSQFENFMGRPEEEVEEQGKRKVSGSEAIKDEHESNSAGMQ
ncbi:hypothetical protein MYU51_015493 [Penicillium brevicompactum]